MRQILSLIFLLLLITSCEDVMEDEISNKKLEVYSPAVNTTYSNFNVLFWWKELDDVTGYRIQIVSPGFDNIQQLFIDTLVTGSKFYVQLYPGTYQWRMRAENSSSTTEYVISTITIDSNSSLTGQDFFTNTPLNDFYSNQSVLEFSWNSFPFATKYQVEIQNLTTNEVISDFSTTNNINKTFTENSYQWRVRAINELNNTWTNYSAFKVFHIDMTPPPVPLPIYPTDNSVDTNSIQLRWIRYEDAVGDSLFVAKDSLFATIVFKEYYTDTSATLTPLTINETYYWKLKSKDKAGNWSQPGSFYRFTVGF